MPRVTLRKVKIVDKKHFAKWWRDKQLLKLTSGILERISDQEVDAYFYDILARKKDRHFVIALNKKAIGHISLAERSNHWHETQIVIGEKIYWGRGYGPRAIRLLIKKAKGLGVAKIYLEVRPNNTRAIHAYERCGFRKIKTVLYPKNENLPRTLRMELNCAPLASS